MSGVEKEDATRQVFDSIDVSKGESKMLEKKHAALVTGYSEVIDNRRPSFDPKNETAHEIDLHGTIENSVD